MLRGARNQGTIIENKKGRFLRPFVLFTFSGIISVFF